MYYTEQIKDLQTMADRLIGSPVAYDKTLIDVYLTAASYLSIVKVCAPDVIGYEKAAEELIKKAMTLEWAQIDDIGRDYSSIDTYAISAAYLRELDAKTLQEKAARSAAEEIKKQLAFSFQERQKVGS